MLAVITEYEMIYLHCKYIILMCLQLNTHKVVLPADLLWEDQIELVAMEHACIVFTFLIGISCRYISGFVTGCICGVLGYVLTISRYILVHFGAIYSKWFGLYVR